MTAIASEFGFDDQEKDEKLGGWVALAFFTLGAPVSFLVGAAADRYPRIRELIRKKRIKNIFID